MAKFRIDYQPKKDDGSLSGTVIAVDNQTSFTAAKASIKAVLQARADAAGTANAQAQADLAVIDS